jgi:hypothetical protein
LIGKSSNYAENLDHRLPTESWEDKKTGEKNYRDLVHVDRIEFLDWRAHGNGNYTVEVTVWTGDFAFSVILLAKRC